MFKWLILEYLRRKGAYDSDHAVSRKELVETLQINPKSLSVIAHRMHVHGWINAFPKHYNRYYWLGSRAFAFLKKYPDFINHPYMDPTERADVPRFLQRLGIR